MVLTPLALALMVSYCATESSVRTEAAVVSVESGGEVWALHDNVTGQSYPLPGEVASYTVALATAQAWIARDARLPACRGRAREECDRGVDVGIAQINSGNFAGFGVTPAQMLRPCPNLRVSAGMLNRTYNAEIRVASGRDRLEREQRALRRALEVYNSGSAYGDPVYVERILDAANGAYVRGVTAASKLINLKKRRG